jgi:ABC-type transporter Mla MlaB component
MARHLLSFSTALRSGALIQKAGMFKVTVSQADNTETWELEGKLSGEWVMELERCWKERRTFPGIALKIRLKAISYIDAAGKRLLAQMYEAGVGIVGCGCMTRAVVEEISKSLTPNWTVQAD